MKIKIIGSMYALIVTFLLCSMNANGDSVYRGYGLYGRVVRWNDHVIVVNEENHLFSNEYCLYDVTPDECRCIMHKRVPFNEFLHYSFSKDIILERRSWINSLLSRTASLQKYSFYKGLNTDQLNESSFIDLPFKYDTSLPAGNRGFIEIVDGVIFKYNSTDYTLSRFDIESGVWVTTKFKNEILYKASLCYRDSSILIDESEAMYYSPGKDTVYQFPAIKNNVPVEYIMYHNQLIYAENDAIKICSENDANSKIIVSSSAGFKITKSHPFIIADNILYISNWPNHQIIRMNLGNYEMLPVLEIDFEGFSFFSVNNGYIYLAKEKKNTLAVDYISVIDLESNTEVNRYYIR